MKKAPKHLSTEAQSWWEKIMGEYLLEDEAGLLLLQTALEAFDRMKESQAIVNKDGASILDRFEQVKSHPMLMVERDCRSQMIQALKALNLDIEPLHDKPGRPGGK